MTNDDYLALAAVEPVTAGMIVGLGTGRAASRAIETLARRAHAERIDLVCVATSHASEAFAKRLGLRVVPMEGVERVDYLFDGADEVDGSLRMIKGRGGALTREKIVAQAATQRTYLVQSAKLVERLGEGAPLPIEVMRFGLAATLYALRERGLEGVMRADFATDDGNPVIDAPLLPGTDVAALAAALDAMAGVVGHGLFLCEADVVLIEDDTGEVSRRARSRG
jgi:ribose 5-phosphate isomerase A